MEYAVQAQVTPRVAEILKGYGLPEAGWSRSIVGFSNTVWIHEKAVIKEYREMGSERTREQWFYRENAFSFAPKCLGMGEDYLILESIQGKGLFHYWSKWSRERREAAFAQGCRMIRQIHGIDPESFPRFEDENRIAILGSEGEKNRDVSWKEQILGKIFLYLDILKNRDACHAVLYEKIRAAVQEHQGALDGGDTVVTYPDFHLDNLLYDEAQDKLFLLDYEDLCLAPADYFLDAPLRMIAYPFLYANEIDDPLQKKEDYEGLLEILQRELHECFAHPQWRKRTAFYALAYDLRQLSGHIGLDLLQKRIAESMEVLTGEKVEWGR